MIAQEFSNEFDTLLNSYSTVPPYGNENKLDITLDEYEKSVFLTKAQEQVVIEIYNGKNPLGDKFEGTEETRRYIDELIKTATITEKTEGNGLSDKSVFFKLPDDLWFITYETVTISDDNAGCHNGELTDVIPVTQDEYYRLIHNPFRGLSFRRAFRLDCGNNTVEIISKYSISDYTVRYLAKPSPIVLVDLNELSIDNISEKAECKLNSAIHRAILERAVRLAIISKTQISSSNK